MREDHQLHSEGDQRNGNIFKRRAPYADTPLIAGWALPYVRYAYETGLMQGSGESFNPQDVLSREQAMTVLGRIIEKYGW